MNRAKLPAVEHPGKRKNLERHAAAQRDLLGLVDNAHTPAANLAEQPVVAQSPLGIVLFFMLGVVLDMLVPALLGARCAQPFLVQQFDAGQISAELIDVSRVVGRQLLDIGLFTVFECQQISFEKTRQLSVGSQAREQRGRIRRGHISSSSVKRLRSRSMARTQSMRTAPEVRSIRAAISSNAIPSRCRNTKTWR